MLLECAVFISTAYVKLYPHRPNLILLQSRCLNNLCDFYVTYVGGNVVEVHTVTYVARCTCPAAMVRTCTRIPPWFLRVYIGLCLYILMSIYIYIYIYIYFDSGLRLPNLYAPLSLQYEAAGRSKQMTVVSRPLFDWRPTAVRRRAHRWMSRTPVL